MSLCWRTSAGKPGLSRARNHLIRNVVEPTIESEKL